MRRLLSLLAALTSAASAADWRATALDPSHVALQADFTADELAAVRLSVPQRILGWVKYDKAFAAAVQHAIAGREKREELYRAGPWAAEGCGIAAHALWISPNGRFYAEGKHGLTGAAAAFEMTTVFLRLRRPMRPGEAIIFTAPDGTRIPFTYNPEVPSPLFKVNQVGYSSESGARYAYLGGWLGELGPWPAPAAETRFELVESATGHVALEGPLVRRMDDPVREGTPFCGEQTCEMDLGAAPAGHYYLRIAGVGRSQNFAIDREGVAAAFALHMKGLYQQRCGCAKTADLTHWTDDACHLEVRRGINPPEEWEYGDRFTNASGTKIKTSHFAVNSAMMDSYGERLSLPGGWHDAADYDRRPMHLQVVGDLAAVYLLRPENFSDSQLAVPERGNGIPDILDEAIWGLRHLLAGQQADGGVGTWIEGTRHPDDADRCMPSRDPVRYCLSRATRQSSVEYAGYAALLARALRHVDTPAALEWSERFRQSAERAWRYSADAKPARNVPMLARAGKSVVTLHYSETTNAPNAELVAKAAANLWALTGADEYAAAFDGLRPRFEARRGKAGWKWSPLLLVIEFGFTDVPGEGFASLRDLWRDRTVKEAGQWLRRLRNAYPYRLPWYGADEGWVHTMSWGSVHPLRQARRFVAAHALTGDAAFLDAAFLANDFHNGCNPNGSTWTAGLGRVYPVRYLSLVSLADDIAEYVPGITPYRNTYGLPAKAKEWVWRNDLAAVRSYPLLRRWANIENQTVAASEFTVWETIGPAAAVTGYLMGPGLQPPNDMREPARDLRDLPGYWALP